jgi:uncharacterized protein
MQKIILDTNVIVSALISDSIPARILYDLVFTKSVEPCLSKEVFEEYVEVLNRDKFSKFPDFRSKSEVVLFKLKELSKDYVTDRKIDALTDTSDNKFLELAVAGSADFLITGNTKDFPMTDFEYTKIVTPTEYWKNFKP